MAHAEAPQFTWHAQHVMVVDEATGAVLLSKGAQESVPMASLTKLLSRPCKIAPARMNAHFPG
jgi:D-alanyl-D-alanine carboxypeptidase